MSAPKGSRENPLRIGDDPVTVGPGTVWVAVEWPPRRRSTDRHEETDADREREAAERARYDRGE